jgi:hypothetical protein
MIGVIFVVLINICCILAWICSHFVARIVKKEKPDVWKKFGWLKKPSFFAFRSSPRQSEASWRLLKWLKTDAAKELRLQNPYFNTLMQIRSILFWITVVLIVLLIVWLLYMFNSGQLIFDFSTPNSRFLK